MTTDVTLATAAPSAPSVPTKPDRSLRAGATLLSITVWASCSYVALVTVGGLDVRPLDLSFVALLFPVYKLFRRSRVRVPLMVILCALAFFVVLLTSALAGAAGVAASGFGRPLDAVASAVRIGQLLGIGAAAAVIAVQAGGRRVLLTSLAAGATVTSALYALAAVGTTLPIELLNLNPGKSTVGPVALGSVILAVTVVRHLAWRGILLAISAVNLVYAVSMTAYLGLILILPVVTWLLLRLRAAPRVTRVAAVCLVAIGCSCFGYVGLRVLRPDALPTRLAAPLTLEPAHEPGRAQTVAGTGNETRSPLTPPAVAPPGSGAEGGATILHRAILMVTAYKVFETSPVQGVGWTHGDDPGTVDDPRIVSEVKRALPSDYPTLYTDVVPYGAHNALLQVMAELGLIGAIPLLLLGAVTLYVGFRAVRRQTASEAVPQLAAAALFATSLVFLMFTGLFPAQVETVLAAVSIGAAAATAGAVRQPAPAAADASTA